MRVQLKQAINLGGQDYKPGVHEMPDELATHWYFLALQANGKAAIVVAPKMGVAKPPKPVILPPPITESEPVAVKQQVDDLVDDEELLDDEDVIDDLGLKQPAKKAKKKKR